MHNADTLSLGFFCHSSTHQHRQPYPIYSQSTPESCKAWLFGANCVAWYIELKLINLINKQKISILKICLLTSPFSQHNLVLAEMTGPVVLYRLMKYLTISYKFWADYEGTSQVVHIRNERITYCSIFLLILKSCQIIPSRQKIMMVGSS